MNNRESLKAKVTWVIHKNGREVRRVENLIVNTGLDFAVELLLDSVTPTTLATLSHMAVGSDGTPATPADVALLAEVARLPFASYVKGGTGVATVEATFTGITGNVAEAGLLDAAAAGVLFNRAVFGAIPLTPTDNLKVTTVLTVTNVTA